jgi:hypothetical protein
MVLLSVAAPTLAWRRGRADSTLLLMVRIGELENGDLFVPVPAECDAEGHLVDGIMGRVASGTGKPLAGCARSSRDGSGW